MPEPVNSFIRVRALHDIPEWGNLPGWRDRVGRQPDVFPFTPQKVQQLADLGFHPANLLLSSVLGRPTTADEITTYVSAFRMRLRGYQRVTQRQRPQFAAHSVIEALWPPTKYSWGRR